MDAKRDHLIAPSLLSCNFGQLQREIETLNQSDADWIHCDIMDGVFVPNISFGFPLLKYIKKYAQKPLDAHLMIVNPDQYLEAFKNHGIYNLTVHYETCPHLNRTIQKMKSIGLSAGVSINPHNPVHLLEDIVKYVDLVLIMSVNPGYGGQTFIDNTYERVSRLKEIILKKNSKALIEVDGGVDMSNARKLIDAGADVLVAGSFVFNANNILNVIKDLKNT